MKLARGPARHSREGARIRVLLTADPELPVPPTLYGGIERVIDLLARGLVARGHSVTLLANKESQTVGRLIPWPGKRSSSVIDTLRNARALAISGINDFDVIHSFSRVAYLVPVLPFGVPKLMTYQRPINPRSVWLGDQLSRRTLWFSAISRHMMADVCQIGNWRLVYNCVSTDHYKYVGEVAQDAPLVFLGRVELLKGTHLAINIAKRAGARLVIAGNIEPEHRGWAEEHVLRHVDGDRIRYIGPVNDLEKNRLLGAARALLMPILWDEPFGIVMAEAMACGTPVLGLERGAVPEVVDHGVTGFVRNSAETLAQDVADLPQISRRSCRDRVERLFSANAVTEAYLRVYREMMGSAP